MNEDSTDYDSDLEVIEELNVNFYDQSVGMAMVETVPADSAWLVKRIYGTAASSIPLGSTPCNPLRPLFEVQYAQPRLSSHHLTDSTRCG